MTTRFIEEAQEQHARVNTPTPLDLAAQFHEAYERLAPSFGYTTRPESRTLRPM